MNHSYLPNHSFHYTLSFRPFLSLPSIVFSLLPSLVRRVPPVLGRRGWSYTVVPTCQEHLNLMKKAVLPQCDFSTHVLQDSVIIPLPPTISSYLLLLLLPPLPPPPPASSCHPSTHTLLLFFLLFFLLHEGFFSHLS